MTLRFLDLAWFAIALLIPALLISGWLWFRAMSASRRIVAMALRTALIVVIAAALAGASIVRKVDRLAVIAVIDLSGSVRGLFNPGLDSRGEPLAAWDRIRNWLDAASTERRQEDTAGIIVLDRSAVAAAALETAPPATFVAEPSLPAQLGTTEGTDLAAGIRLAAAMAPPDAATRIIVISDGVETSGDALRAARETAPIIIDTLHLPYRVSGEVAVESVDAPSIAPSGATVRVRVTLRSAAPARGTLELSREDQPVDLNGDAPGIGRPVELTAGLNTVSLPVELPPGRVHRLRAVFKPAEGFDTLAANNSGEGVVLSPGRTSVLIVDGLSGGDPQGEGALLGRTLAAGGLEVQAVAPAAVRNDQLWLQQFDLIMLQNVPADAVGPGVSDALARYVTLFGGGLVMVGGPDAFGAGGWKGTPIEPILPVVLDLPERLVAPAAAVVFVIDCSGSMGFRVLGSGRSQQDIANEGAAAAAEALDKSDLLGVIIFSERERVLIPLGPNRDPAAAAQRIRTIRPDGGTNLPPALEEAHRQLKSVAAEVKHVIILSDGRSQNSNVLPRMAERMRADDIRISTIAVGDEADRSMLTQIAIAGGGTPYTVIDPNTLPRIFVKAVRVVRTPQIRNIPFSPVVFDPASELIAGLPSPIPPLGGLVLTQARLDRTITRSLNTPDGEPVLAHWNAGIGRVAAFTSDAALWAASGGWPDWPGFSRLWTQTARAIARPQPSRGQELAISLEDRAGGRGRLVARVNASEPDGSPVDGLAIEGWVHGPGERLPLRLEQVGPGEYEGSAPADEAGAFIVTLTPSFNGRPMPPLIGGASRSAGVEYRRLESNPVLLREIASATGGIAHQLPDPAVAAEPLNLFSRRGIEPVLARTPIWHHLLVAIIGLYLLDVGCRRIAWDRLISSEFGLSMRQRANAAVRGRGREAAAMVDRLRQVDDRAARPSSDRAGPAPLGETDAREIIRAQAARRKAERAAARRAERGQAKAPPPIEIQSPPASPGPDAPVQPSLAEAKRRARRQIDDKAAD